MKSNSKWYVISIVMVFAAGVLAGAIGGIRYEKKSQAARIESRRGEMRERIKERIHKSGKHEPRQGLVENLTRELSLTEEQVTGLQKILEENEKQFFTIREEMQTRMESFRGKTFAELAKILDEEQVKKLEQFRKEHEGLGKMMGGMRGKHGKTGGERWKDRDGGDRETRDKEESE